MSCQQAPRLTEDPYVFTETVPITPVLFNPQKSRHQQHPKAVTQPTSLQSSTQDTTSTSVSQQLFGGRFNGTTTAIETPSASITQQQHIINGMHKNVISITTISNGNSDSAVPIKLPQQTQNSHPKIVTTAALTVTPSAVSSGNLLPNQVISWNQAQSAASSPAQHLLQQQQHQNQQQQQQQQQPFFALTNNPSGNVQGLSCASSHLPPSNFHQNTLAQHIQKVGSSLTNTSSQSSPVPWPKPQNTQQQQQQQPQQQYSKIVSVRSHNSPPLTVSQHRENGRDVTSGVTSSIASESTSFSFDSSHPLPTAKLNHSDYNEIPLSVIYRTTPVKDEAGESPRISGERSIEAYANSLSNNAPSPVSKTFDFCEKSNVFATPAKRDCRVLSSSARKSLKAAATGAPGKAKRLHSQTTHHEALQRISSTTSHSSSSSLAPSLSPSIRRRFKVGRSSGEWHAPDTYIFDSVSPLTSLIERRQRSAEKCDSSVASAKALCVQQHWMGVYDLNDSADISGRTSNIGREERIEMHKALLRRQAVQLISSQEFLKPTAARSRLVFVSKLLHKFKSREDCVPAKKCCVPSCTNNALALTSQCYMHITRNLDQHLFLPCTAKFADNTQCRIPVFDITHELPLCREHAWKRDNYKRIVQEQRPKAKIARKPAKTNVMCGRPPKRSKKKRKGSTSSLESIGSSNATIISTPTSQTGGTSLAPPSVVSNCVTSKFSFDSSGMVERDYVLKNEITQAVSQSNLSHHTDMEVLNMMRPQTQQDLLTQDMLSICENSSVYASSEDTGVGGLSESELMVGTQDAEEIPLGDTRLLEEHDLTNVFNTLPVDAFSELFTVVRQDEREEVERALELADKQIKSLQQMTGSDTDFLRDLLDGSDQILDDTDICTEIVSPHSPDTSGIDTNTLFVDGGSNSTAGSCTGPTPTDIRGLVQT